MKNVLILLVTLLALSNFANANEEKFVCRLDSNKKVFVRGSWTLESASIKIQDDDEYLEVKELDLRSKNIEMPRLIRKKEDNYSFAKYYSELSAWEDIDISFPKNVKSRHFKAFLTLYFDNGDFMVPRFSDKMSCILK